MHKFECMQKAKFNRKETFFKFGHFRKLESFLVLAPVNQWFVNFQSVGNEKIISQIVQVNEVCDQNGDKVSKSNKSCHIYSIRQKGLLALYEKCGTLSVNDNGHLSMQRQIATKVIIC